MFAPTQVNLLIYISKSAANLHALFSGRSFLCSFVRSVVNPRLNGKSAAEVLMGITARTISHALLLNTTSSKPDELLKRVNFNVGDHVLARDFRPGQPALLLDDVGVFYMKFK